MTTRERDLDAEAAAIKLAANAALDVLKSKVPNKQAASAILSTVAILLYAVYVSHPYSIATLLYGVRTALHRLCKDNGTPDDKGTDTPT